VNQHETPRPPRHPPEEEQDESNKSGEEKLSIKARIGAAVLARPFSPLALGKKPCFDCNYILSPFQEFCPNCGAFQIPAEFPLIGLDSMTIAGFVNQQLQRPLQWPIIETAGFLLVPLILFLVLFFGPWLALTKLLLSPVLCTLVFFCGRQLAKYYLFHKWLPYIRTNRFRSTFLILEQQIKNRMSQIEKKIGELEGLRERTNTFSSPEGQSTVQGTLDSAVSSLKETHKEFNAQWWNLQLFLWFNRITGIGVKGNQDGMKNNVERVEEFTYLGHHYINQLKKDKQLTAEKSEALRGRVQKGIELLKKIQEVVVAQEAETLIKQVKPLGEGFPEELSIEGKISFLCTDAAQVSLESFTDVIERLDQEYSRLSIERKIANDTKSLMRE